MPQYREHRLSLNRPNQELETPGARLAIGFVLMALGVLSCPMDFDHMGELSIRRRFWLGVFSAGAIVILVPVFWRGRTWQRLLAGFLILLPLLNLFEALTYLWIKA